MTGIGQRLLAAFKAVLRLNREGAARNAQSPGGGLTGGLDGESPPGRRTPTQGSAPTVGAPNGPSSDEANFDASGSSESAIPNGRGGARDEHGDAYPEAAGRSVRGSPEERQAPGAWANEGSHRSFDRMVAAGSSGGAAGAGRLQRVVIGLDFGTSSTKIVVRMLDEPDEPVLAIPAPAHCRGEGDSFLWRTVLWIRKNGEFIGYPEPGANALDSLKTDMVSASIAGDKQVQAPPCEAAGGYLALAIRYVRGWLLSEHGSLFRGRRAVWLVNLGLPAASYDNNALMLAYRKTGIAALKLADSGKAISRSAMVEFLGRSDVQGAGRSAEAAEEVGVAVIPETAAAATTFAKSARRARGLYAMVDVGAMTLDVCTFRIVVTSNGGTKFPLLRAVVRFLGVEAEERWFKEEGAEDSEFADEVRKCLHGTIWDTKRYDDPLDPAFASGNCLPVFVGGGGAANRLHRKEIEDLGPWLQKHSKNSGIRLLPSSPPIAKIGRFPKNFERFAVASGLSHQAEEIGEIVPPSKIGPVPKPQVHDIERLYISKDHV